MVQFIGRPMPHRSRARCCSHSLGREDGAPLPSRASRAFRPSRRSARSTSEISQPAKHLNKSRVSPILTDRLEIGSASCRERLDQYVLISVVAGSIKKKKEL